MGGASQLPSYPNPFFSSFGGCFVLPFFACILVSRVCRAVPCIWGGGPDSRNTTLSSDCRRVHVSGPPNDCALRRYDLIRAISYQTLAFTGVIWGTVLDTDAHRQPLLV